MPTWKKTRSPRRGARPRRGLSFSTSSTSRGMMVGVIESDGTTERVTTDESTTALSKPGPNRVRARAGDGVQALTLLDPRPNRAWTQ